MSYVSAEPEHSDTIDDAAILAAKGDIPGHVVYRDFVNETVMLNLETGTYHGLNRTAGMMLAAIDSAPSVRTAAERLASEYGWELDTVEGDIVALCRTLAESGLLAIETGDAGNHG